MQHETIGWIPFSSAPKTKPAREVFCALDVIMANKCQDVEFLVFHLIRTEYEQKYRESLNFPIAIKHLVNSFTKRIFKLHSKSISLTLMEDLNFYSILSQQFKHPSLRNVKIKSIFNASLNNFRSTSFHSLCDHIPHTLTIIRSNYDNIFGGYFSKSFTSSGEWLDDDKSFLFMIKSADGSIRNRVFKLKKHGKKNMIHNRQCFGPCFGLQDIVIKDRCNHMSKSNKFSKYKKNGCYSKCDLYDHDTVNLSGAPITDDYINKSYFKVKDYEVLQIVFN